MEQLEKKKAEFRKRVDRKREKMKNMTEDEKEEFLFRLRLLRTDAADEPSSEREKCRDNDEIKKKKKRKADDEERLRRQRKEREEQVELDRLTREVMMNQ